MSQRDHTMIEELLAADALDGLTLEDHAILVREQAAHGDCDECRHLQLGFRDTAGRMAFMLEPIAVDPTIPDRILESERGALPPPVPSAPATDELTERRRTRRGRVLVAVIGVAAVTVLILGAFVVAANRGGTTLATASPAQTIVSFDPALAGAGSLAMAFTPGQPGVAIWGSGLPDPGAGMTYEIWMIADDQAVSGGCVTPVDGSVAVFVDADLGSSETMAVTAEPDACPAAPTGAPVLTASLTA